MAEIQDDNQYGNIKYGESLYGIGGGLQTLRWGFVVDWDEDGLWDTNEATRMVDINISRGRKRLLKPSGQGFETIPTGKCTVVLKNHDGRYDGWNPESPLYPNVSFGKRMQVIVWDKFWSEEINRRVLFTGVISDIRPSGYGVDAIVTIHCVDGMDYLRQNVARVPLNESITVDEAIGKILDAVNYPYGRSLESTVETIDYWWSSGNKRAMSEIEDLALSFLGYFYCDVNNNAVFLSRSNVPVLDIIDGYGQVVFDQNRLLKDISSPQPYDILRNTTRIKVHPRVESGTVTVWESLGTPLFIDIGRTANFFVDYSYEGQSTPVRNAAIATFLANTQSDFGGSDLTADCTISLTSFGDTGKITITNNSASAVYVYVAIEGNAIYEVNTSDVTYPEDPDTITNQRELFLDLIWQQDPNVGVDLVGVLGAFYATPSPAPSIKVENRSLDQFFIDLFRPVYINIPAIGLDERTYRVAGIEHRSIKPNCQAIETRYYLEPYIGSGEFMRWDTFSEWDTETIFGY